LLNGSPPKDSGDDKVWGKFEGLKLKGKITFEKVKGFVSEYVFTRMPTLCHPRVLLAGIHSTTL